MRRGKKLHNALKVRKGGQSLKGGEKCLLSTVPELLWGGRSSETRYEHKKGKREERDLRGGCLVAPFPSEREGMLPEGLEIIVLSQGPSYGMGGSRFRIEPQLIFG